MCDLLFELFCDVVGCFYLTKYRLERFVTLRTQTILSGVFFEIETAFLNVMWRIFSVQEDKIILSIVAKTQKENVYVYLRYK